MQLRIMLTANNKNEAKTLLQLTKKYVDSEETEFTKCLKKD